MVFGGKKGILFLTIFSEESTTSFHLGGSNMSKKKGQKPVKGGDNQSTEKADKN
jgi:hypothetical protein